VDGKRIAAWRHIGARDGFEVLVVDPADDGLRCEGHVAAVEDGVAWALQYSLVLDQSWATQTAHLTSLSENSRLACSLERSDDGWVVDGLPMPELSGCLDVDLEASVFTNALPIHRLRLAPGDTVEAPAAYVRVPSLEVERLEQAYRRLPDEGERQRYDYRSPRFDYRAVLVYDEVGLVVDYPGLAARVA
jgi:hypothetical protein